MLSVKRLNLKLGEFQLGDINLDVKYDEYFVLLGPSGSGKTVLLETLAGRYKPLDGEIYFNSSNLSNLCPEHRNIGFVYQQYELFSHMTVEQNIVFGLKIRKVDKKTIISKLNDLAELFDIQHLLKRYPYNLSGGEKQRTALARALIISPDILLLDEPLSALDPLNKELLIAEFKKIHSRFKTIIVHVTHDVKEALYLADKIGIMNNGRILHIGTKEEMKESDCSYFSNIIEIESRR